MLISSLWSQIDAVRGNVKRPGVGRIKTIASVRDHEIVIWIRVPRPDGVASHWQITDDERACRVESISAVAAYCTGTGLQQIHRDIDRRPSGIVDAHSDLVTLQRSWQDCIDTWIHCPGIATSNCCERCAQCWHDR